MSDLNESLLDMKQVKNLQEAFQDGLKEFMNVYYKDFEQNESKLSVALQEKQLDSIAKLAHAMKGSSLNVGARSLAQVCDKIETAGKAGKFGDAQQEYQTLKTVYLQSKEAFNHLFN